MRRRALQLVVVAVTVASAVLLGAESAYAAPCNSRSGFPPQMERPVGQGIDSPGITDAASYDGVVDFGDGTVVQISLEQPFSHEYSEPGTYQVTSTGSGMAFTSDGGTVPCEENQFLITTVTVYPLEARMTVQRDGGSDNAPTYTFDGSASIPEGRITEFSWDFGDGSYGDGATASHTYRSPGRFTATLTILDDRGNPASASQTVRAGDVNVIDLGEIAGRPELDPNVFASLAGGDPASAGGGSSSFPWFAMIVGGLGLAGAVLVLFRMLHRGPTVTTASTTAGPAAAATDPPAPPSDLPETIGDSGIVYAQQASSGDAEGVDTRIRSGYYNLASIASGSHMIDRTAAGEPITQQDYEMQVRASELMSQGASATAPFVEHMPAGTASDAGRMGGHVLHWLAEKWGEITGGKTHH